MATTFRVLQISDLHFNSQTEYDSKLDYMLKKTGRGQLTPTAFYESLIFAGHSVDAARDLAKFLLANELRPKLLLVSGDLAQTGRLPDQIEASLFFDPPTRPGGFINSLGQTTIGALKVPLFVMPGNHDRWADQFGRTGSPSFDSYFDAHWKPSNHVATKVLKSRSTGERLALLAADFSLRNETQASFPSYLYRLGEGHAGQSTLTELSNRTTALRDKYPGIGVVWVSHFPPTRGKVGPFGGLKLHRREELLQEARSVGVSLILSGHVHRQSYRRYEGVAVFCAGATCVANDPDANLLHSLELKVDRGSATLAAVANYKWQRSAGTFVLN